MPATVARGGSRSAAESMVAAPTIWASEGPNMLSAVSNGESVARYTRVPRARPLTVEAAVRKQEDRKSGVNSRVRKSSE